LSRFEIPMPLRANQVSHYEIDETPIKNLEDKLVTLDVLEQQLFIVTKNLIPVDFKVVRGTCFDERSRALLLNGDPTSPRPAVPGGPDIFSLAIGQLTGQLKSGSADDRVRSAKEKNNSFGILSGAHEGCAASNLNTWMKFVADNAEAVKAYAYSELGDSYHEEAAEKVVSEARVAVESAVYKGFNEQSLKSVYGKQEVGAAFELLAVDPDTGETIPHEGNLLIRLKRPNLAADISAIYKQQSAAGVGKGAFVMNDPYAKLIKGVWSSGVDAKKMSSLADHAQEILLAAIANCVPNPTLYQVNIS
jgi:hypothetical protein